MKVALDDVLSRLDLVRRAPHGFMARCPAHHDRTPSLSIREFAGQPRLHCFAGCLEDDCWRAIGLERPGRAAPLTIFQTALFLGRTQARRRDNTVAIHQRLLDELRGDATRMGDGDEAWDLLAEVANLERMMRNGVA